MYFFLNCGFRQISSSRSTYLVGTSDDLRCFNFRVYARNSFFLLATNYFIYNLECSTTNSYIFIFLYFYIYSLWFITLSDLNTQSNLILFWEISIFSLLCLCIINLSFLLSVEFSSQFYDQFYNDTLSYTFMSPGLLTTKQREIIVGLLLGDGSQQ